MSSISWSFRRVRTYIYIYIYLSRYISETKDRNITALPYTRNALCAGTPCKASRSISIGWLRTIHSRISPHDWQVNLFYSSHESPRGLSRIRGIDIRFTHSRYRERIAARAKKNAKMRRKIARLKHRTLILASLVILKILFAVPSFGNSTRERERCFRWPKDEISWNASAVVT